MTDEERVRKVAGKISDDLYLPYDQQTMVLDAVRAGFEEGVASVTDPKDEDNGIDPFIKGVADEFRSRASAASEHLEKVNK